MTSEPNALLYAQLSRDAPPPPLPPPHNANYLRGDSERAADKSTHTSDSASHVTAQENGVTWTKDGYDDARQVQISERLPPSVPLSLKAAGGVGGNAVSQSSNGYTGAKDTSTLGTPSSTGRHLSISVMSQDSSSLFQPTFHATQHRSASHGASDSDRLMSPAQLRKKVEQLAVPRDVHGAPMAVRRPNYGRVLNFTEEQRNDNARGAERLLKPFVYPKPNTHTTPYRDATIQRLAEPRSRREPAVIRSPTVTTTPLLQTKALPPPRRVSASPNAPRATHVTGDVRREDTAGGAGQPKAAVLPTHRTSPARGRVPVTSKKLPRGALPVTANKRAQSAPRAKANHECDCCLQNIIAKPHSSYFGPSVIHESGSTSGVSGGARQGTRHGDPTDTPSSMYTRMQELAASRALLRPRSFSATRAPSSSPPPAPLAGDTAVPTRTLRHGAPAAVVSGSLTPTLPVPLAAREEVMDMTVVLTAPSQAPRPPLAQHVGAAASSAGHRIMQHVQSIVPGKRTPVQIKTRRVSEQTLVLSREASTIEFPRLDETTGLDSMPAAASQPPVVYAAKRVVKQAAEGKILTESPCTGTTSSVAPRNGTVGGLHPSSPNLVLKTSKPCPLPP